MAVWDGKGSVGLRKQWQSLPHQTEAKMRAVHNEQFSDKMEAKMVLGT